MNRKFKWIKWKNITICKHKVINRNSLPNFFTKVITIFHEIQTHYFLSVLCIIKERTFKNETQIYFNKISKEVKSHSEIFKEVLLSMDEKY